MQHSTQTFNFALGSMVTKCQMIQEVIYIMGHFNTNISAHFKWEMLIGWAIDQNCIKLDFIANCLCFQISYILHSLSLSWLSFQSFNWHGSKSSKLANESIAIPLSWSLPMSRTWTWNFIPLLWGCFSFLLFMRKGSATKNFFMATIFQLKEVPKDHF